MNESRRQAIAGAAALMVAGWSGLAQAQPSAANYPSGPVKIVVGFSAGGPTDLAARLIAAKLQVAFGQTFIVENRPGAGSNLASEIVAKAAPDGYTLLMAAAPGRFSTMKVWPKAICSLAAIRRAARSVGPPAAKPTTIFTGALG